MQDEREEKYSEERVPDEKLARYAAIKEEAERLYKTFGKVRCPALGGKLVSFTSEGFNHLIYRIKKKERNRRVQIMRF